MDVLGGPEVRGAGCQLGLAACVLKLNAIGISDTEHELEMPIPRLWHEACLRGWTLPVCPGSACALRRTLLQRL